MSNKKPNIVIVGCGYWGQNLIRVLSNLKTLYGTYDIDSEKDDKSFDSYEAVLEDKKVDAVVISTPVMTHYELTKKALSANKDVFVEKPLAMNYEEGKELVEHANNKGRILMVGHLLLYHPAIDILQAMISKGELGKINYIYSNRLNLGKLRTEENVFQSFAPHDISVILSLVGEEPSVVTYHEGAFINKNISDMTITFMEFPCGTKAHIFVSWLHPYKEQRLVVVGTKAMAVFDDRSAEKLRIYPHKIIWERGKNPVAEKAAEYKLAPELLGKHLEPLKIECQHFITCIKTRNLPRTDGKQALAVLKILDRCHESSPDYYVHKSSFIDDGVRIGKKTKIWHFSHILRGSVIGDNCNIGQNVMIGPDVKVGNNVKIQNNVSIYDGVTLEDDVFCGPSCVFTNVINPRSHINRKDEFKKTLIKRGATIGANATILCGVTIGEYAFIGAGSVVTKDVLAYTLAVGVPAKEIKTVNKNGVSNEL